METENIRKKNRELTKLRKLAGLTQRDVQLVTGNLINYTKMSCLENGYFLPTDEEAQALAEAFKVSKEEIIDTFKS